MQLEAERYVQRALDAVDAHLAITLRRVAIAATEERAAVEHRQVESRAGTEFAYVQVAAEGSGRTSTELAIVCARHAHHSQERAHRHNRWSERTGGLAVQRPVKEIRLAKTIFEKAQALDDAGPSPAGVTRGQHIDLQHVAGFCALDPDGAGERVNARAVNGQVFRGGHARPHLAAACVHAFNLHFVTWINA